MTTIYVGSIVSSPNFHRFPKMSDVTAIMELSLIILRSVGHFHTSLLTIIQQTFTDCVSN